MQDEGNSSETRFEDSLGVEHGYLNHEQLTPDEIASIETALGSASNFDRRGRPTRWVGLAAIAATVIAMVVLLGRFPSRPVDTPTASPPAAVEPQAMVLEIQRTDIPDSKPYKLIIQLETR